MDDWTTSDRASVYGPRSSQPDLDLPDDDEIEDMAAALGDKVVYSASVAAMLL